jgi:tRNA (cmo5U34)-methyltransferase
MSGSSADDRLYAKPIKKIADFAFDESVARVFPDMIARSVPGYAALLPLIGMLVEQHMQPGGRCYDLGCSLGAVSVAVEHFLRDTSRDITGCEIIGVDNSPAMIERCRSLFHGTASCVPIQWLCEDMQTTPIDQAVAVVLNFTLQFIEPEQRPALLEKIWRGLRPGGILILSEKVYCEDNDAALLLTDLHHAFKKANGYSELEIAQKRSALENVLFADSITQHRQRLLAAGFSRVLVWFQCLNFVSLLAVK